MSKLEALSIRGIRSFDPHEEAKIRFFSPLTLILGANGCGKTTIIESLKYITTGDVPPGCGKGASFVHDSKAEMDQRYVKAQLRIMLRDTKGERVVCSRSLETMHTMKNIVVKTLDTTIERTRPDGTKAQITNKCMDFECEVPIILGVSKPILQNVIFCHQEESNWPLQEGKKVKDRFDAIFSATKYIKCMETFRKLHVNLRNEIKKHTEILELKRKWKVEVAGKKMEYATLETDMKELEDKISALEADKKRLEPRICEIESVEKNLLQYSKKIGGKEAQLKTLEKGQEEHKSSLTAPITCSDDELFDMILNFDRQVREKESSVKISETKVMKLNGEIARYKKEESREVEKLGELKAMHTSHLASVEDQNRGLSKIAKELDSNEYKDKKEFSNIDAEELLKILSYKISEKKALIQKEKSKYEQKEKCIQDQINEIKIKEATLDHEIKMCSDSEISFRSKWKDIQRKIMRYNSDLSNTSIEELEKNIASVEKDLKSQENTVDVDKINREMKALKSEELVSEDSIDKIKTLINRMNRQVDIQAKYDSKSKDLKEHENKVQHLLSRRSDELEHLFEEIPEENLQSKLNNCSNELQRRLQDNRNQEKKLNKKKTELETRIASQEKDLNRREAETKVLNQKIQSLTDGGLLEDILEKSKLIIEEKGRDEGHLSSSATILNGYVNKLRQKSCCPLCHRDFDDLSYKTELIEELQDKVQNIPSKLEQVKKEVQRQKKLYDDLVELKPQRERYNILIKDIDNIKAGIETDKQEMRSVQQELEDLIQVKEMNLSDEEMINTVRSDVAVIDNTQRKIRQVKEEIDRLKSSLGNVEESMSREEALEQEMELNNKIKSLRKQREEKVQIIDKHKQAVEEHKNKLISLKQKHIDLKNKMQELETLKTEKNKTDEEIKKANEKKEQLKIEVEPLRSEVKEMEKDFVDMRSNKEKWLDMENEELSKQTEKYKNANTRKKNIMNYVDSRGKEKLEEVTKMVDKLGDVIFGRENDKKEEEDNISTIQKELTVKIKEKHALDEEKKHREKEVEIHQLKLEIEALNETVNSFNGDALRKEKDKIQTKWHDINNERLTLRGQKVEKTNRVQALKLELNREDVRNAEKNYKELMIKKRATEIAATDLDKYYKALDTSIMKFHTEKMKTINKIIRELWRTTYRGNDIDTIEIKTTNDTESQGVEKRRTYNYRVVMMKNQKEMDMRGRCSAGQKVLASLIIRIALAETFSSNCGVLALDEPTTNLDKNNIESLAHALLKIVKRRSAQRNFQLLIITHDEDFLSILTKADYLEKYYRLQRNARGLSTIEELGA